MAVTVACVLGFAAFSVYRMLDQELLPQEDRGMFRITMLAPDGVGLGYMDQQTRKVESILRPLVDSGEVQALFTVVGMGDPNRSQITAPLADWNDRGRSQQEIMLSLNMPVAEIPGMQASITGSNSLNIRGGAGNRVGFALIGNEYTEIFEAAKLFARTIEERSANLSRPEISYEVSQPQLLLEVDRRRAADLGISLDSLAETLRVMIDGDEIVDLNVHDEAVPILLEASMDEINDPSDLVNLYVGAGSGNLLPLSSVVKLTEQGIASELPRIAQRRAIQVNADISPGYPLQSAVNELKGIAAEILPEEVSMIMQGEAATLEETSRDVTITYVIAFIVVFLVLCAQFEGFTSAIVVMLLVPFGIAAAVFALVATGTSLNIYSQIGLVMLIGLMAKNGVLVVEFADQLRDRGYGIREAIEKGAVIRLRPVTMTMMCTVLGGLPLILSGGAGAEARSSIGWVIFGGLGLAAMFTLYLTPVLYLILARFSSARAKESLRLSEELKDVDLAEGHL
jgi:multidrug efflux pump subunit AcrB